MLQECLCTREVEESPEWKRLSEQVPLETQSYSSKLKSDLAHETTTQKDFTTSVMRPFYGGPTRDLNGRQGDAADFMGVNNRRTSMHCILGHMNECCVYIAAFVISDT